MMRETRRSGAFDAVLLDELAQIAQARARKPAAAGSAPAPSEDAARCLAEASAAEREVTSAQPAASPADAWRLAQRMQLRGLAFSGGGIRSATFNLGVTQALCQGNLLRCFDYLSTVSGGGYIGSWLSAQLHQSHLSDESRTPRAAVEALERELTPLENGQPRAREAEAIGFLRQYSNYLTPRVGLLSTDSLAAIANYVRNVLLIQTIVVALLLAVLALPRVLYAGAAYVESIAGIVGAVLLTLSAAAIGVNLRAPKDSSRAKTAFVIAFVVVPAVLGAFFVAIDLTLPKPLFENVHEQLAARFGGIPGAVSWAACLAAMYGAVSAIVALLPSEKRETPLRWLALMSVAGIIAGAVGGAGLWALWNAMQDMSPHAARWLAVSLAPFAVLYVLGLMIVVHLGLIGRLFDYQVHEWWARDGAWIIGVSIGVGGTFAIAVYGPALVVYARDAIVYAGGPVWLLTTLWGVLAGKSAGTSGKDSAAQTPNGAVKVSWTERLLPLAPYIFILGLALILSYALYAMLEGDRVGTAHEVLGRMAATPAGKSAAALAAFIGVFVLFAWRVDINLFSLHNFYRNRLTRCYLGAARAVARTRRPHPFTGFDSADDFRLAELVARDGTVQRPFHILNAAINMSAGSNLAWQQRKAGSFFFTPRHCGYQLPPSGDPDEVAGGFVRTSDYMPSKSAFGPADDNGPMLGSVVAVSGAAASPNWGFHTSTAVAFLLTLFNVRLGRWCPNTARTTVAQYQSPTFGGGLLLQELFGWTDEKSSYVYLSDGGHFENLGVYELVRRRCSVILVGDCGQDIPMRFDDLADALRKCYTDFGVRIDLDVGPTARLSDKGMERFSKESIIEGSIHYPARGSAPAFTGRIFLVKPTLRDVIYSAAPDVRNYALSNDDFPQQSTADQFFDEAQFESYRKLGYLIGSELLNRTAEGGTPVKDLLGCY